MNPILTTGVQKLPDAPCVIEVDEYVPLRFRTYDKPLGSVYLNLGNRSTSLADLMVDPISRVLRGVTLTSFEKFAAWPKIGTTNPVEGLPALTGPWNVPERDLPMLEYKSVNMSVDFSVSLRGNELVIFWGDLASLSGSSVFEKLQCYISGSELRGVRFFNLDHRDAELLTSHGKQKMH